MRIADPSKTNRGRPTANSAAAAMGVGMPPQPKTLSERAKYYWGYFGKILTTRNLLSPADLISFTEFCEMCSEIDALKAFLREHGEFVKTHHGTEMARAQTKQLFRTRQLALKVGDRFGLSPSARSTMRTQAEQTPADDPLLKMFAKRKSWRFGGDVSN